MDVVYLFFLARLPWGGARHGAPTWWKDGLLGARQSAESWAFVGEMPRGGVGGAPCPTSMRWRCGPLLKFVEEARGLSPGCLWGPDLVERRSSRSTANNPKLLKLSLALGPLSGSNSTPGLIEAIMDIVFLAGNSVNQHSIWCTRPLGHNLPREVLDLTVSVVNAQNCFSRPNTYNSKHLIIHLGLFLSSQEVFQRLIRNRPYVYLCLASSMRNVSTYALWAWLPTFYSKVLSIPSEEYGVNIALVVLFGGGCGCAIGGILTDRWNIMNGNYCLIDLKIY